MARRLRKKIARFFGSKPKPAKPRAVTTQTPKAQKEKILTAEGWRRLMLKGRSKRK